MPTGMRLQSLSIGMGQNTFWPVRSVRVMAVGYPELGAPWLNVTNCGGSMFDIAWVLVFVLLFGSIALAGYGKIHQFKLSVYLRSRGGPSYLQWRKSYLRGGIADAYTISLYRKYITFYGWGLAAFALCAIMGFLLSWFASQSLR